MAFISHVGLVLVMRATPTGKQARMYRLLFFLVVGLASSGPARLVCRIRLLGDTDLQLNTAAHTKPLFTARRRGSAESLLFGVSLGSGEVGAAAILWATIHSGSGNHHGRGVESAFFFS